MSAASTPFDPAPSVAQESCMLVLDPQPTVFPVPHITDWMPDLPVVANLIPQHEDSWDTNEFAYNMEITDNDLILQEVVQTCNASKPKKLHAFVRAGPRSQVVFRGPEVRAAVVTCGGLCPGINNVIRDIVLRLSFNYGVKHIDGIRNGYQGFYKPELQPPLALTPKLVENIHDEGGTFLGTSRGGFELDPIIESIRRNKYDVLFCIGGDGTLRGATAISEEVKRQRIPVAVAVVPKTIDNDVPLIDKTFGFQTAVEEAQRAIKCAKVEARADRNSIVIVQLMGRAAGFIAVHSALASGDVDLVLIPEVPFEMYGAHSVCSHLKRRLQTQGYAVVVVAEGAGSQLLPPTGLFDASGNPVLPEVGQWLKGQIAKHFREEEKMHVSVRFIDPSYMIRSVPAHSDDSMYCMLLASQAVHGAMAGLTGFTVGLVNNRTVYIPNELLTNAKPKRVNSKGRMWERVLMMTRQPRFTADAAPPITAAPAAPGSIRAAAGAGSAPVREPTID